MNKRSQTGYPLEIYLPVGERGDSSFFSRTLGFIKNAAYATGLSPLLFAKYPPTLLGSFRASGKNPRQKPLSLAALTSAEVQRPLTPGRNVFITINWSKFSPLSKSLLPYLSPPVSTPTMHNFRWSWSLFRILQRVGVTQHSVNRSIAFFFFFREEYLQQMHLLW